MQNFFLITILLLLSIEGYGQSERDIFAEELAGAALMLTEQEVHEDMVSNFELYPAIWGLSRPDPNIDHRRVPNLMKYFERHGKEKARSGNAVDYVPGDIVCWNLGGAVTHIGIIASSRSPDGLRPMVVHNIGSGQVLEDCLFDYRIIGHYIYQGK